MTPAGVLNGVGQGVVMSAQGDSLSYVAQGVGKPGKGMSASWRYSIVVQTASTKWARLNGMLVIGEWDTDEQGNGKGQLFEWK
jgi:hypothetical protein